MGNFANNAITDVGRMLLADVQAGAVFTPTRIVMGSGSMTGGTTTQGMTDVITPVKSLAINKKKRTPDGKCVFGGVYTNEEVTAPFYFRELALYAKAVYLNVDGSVKSETAETLYSYGNAGATADYMPAYSTSTVVEKQMDLVVWVGNDAQVDLTIESGVYVTHEYFDAHAVPLDGSKSMTGRSLYLNNRSALVGADEGRAVLNSFDTAGSEDTYRGIAVFNVNDVDDIAKALCLAVRNYGEGELLFRIYGEHNKPTPAALGAVNKNGDTVRGYLQFTNTDEYFAVIKGRTIATGQTHFLTMGVGADGSTTLEHYTCDSEIFDSLKRDGRLELNPAIVNDVPSPDALILRGATADNRAYRIYGEHYSPAVVATAELI